MTDQRKRALAFQRIHQTTDLFVLPNVWDPGSAVVAERAGFEAIATTSAGVAFTFGYADGQQIPLDLLAGWVEKMTARLSIPLSVDVERGYSDAVQEVQANIRTLIRAGGVGINIEDGIPDRNGPYLDDLGLCREKLSALSDLKAEMEIPFVINARTCAFLLGIGEETKRLDLAIDRCNAFAEAGADCVFVPGLIQPEAIRTLVESVPVPVNILLHPATADLGALRELGVRRLSIGSSGVRAVLAHFMGMMEDLKQHGETGALLNHGLDYGRANAFFEKQMSKE